MKTLQQQTTPNTWLLFGHKAGDNTQLLALADALPWDYSIKHIRYRSTELLTNLLLPPSLAGVRRGDSDPLAPPWPDLVITAGRRNEPVARWIKRQSGGQSRLVHVGRPWSAPARFDLVITTPQYQVPEGPNVLLNSLPLHRTTAETLKRAATGLQPRLQGLPRPYLGLLVGGDSGPYVFDRRRAACLAGEASLQAQRAGGSLLVTTSARTPRPVATALEQHIDAPCHFYHWRPGDDQNPYFGYLALADRFIVTGESISMLTEACATGRPVQIFDPGYHPVPLHCRGSARAPEPVDRRPWWLRRASYRWKPITHRLAQRLGPARMRREVGVMHRHLIGEGRASWLGEEPAEASRPPPLDDLERAVARVKALF
ncbi:MAG TPA: nucleoside-diphosphate sugar epimerase [Sedimenticola sp.]|nr:nucleoside-diphosphate sugar epimerase [Sedimenticola sp.]